MTCPQPFSSQESPDDSPKFGGLVLSGGVQIQRGCMLISSPCGCFCLYFCFSVCVSGGASPFSSDPPLLELTESGVHVFAFTRFGEPGSHPCPQLMHFLALSTVATAQMAEGEMSTLLPLCPSCPPAIFQISFSLAL